MTTVIGINGFGRIGRLVLRACLKRGIKVNHLNDPGQDAALMAYLLKYDSTHGRYHEEICSDKKDRLIIGSSCISVSQEKDPRDINWRNRDVGLVVETSGIFTSRTGANLHIEGGASRVIITSPSNDAPTFAYGVNHTSYEPDSMRIVSCASCTTNCIAPVAKVLNDEFGILEGMVTTIHATTGTQRTIDGPSRKDWRGGRGAGQNIIPSSTGAAKALAKVLPELDGVLKAISFRVPTPNVSVIDLTCKLRKSTCYENVKKIMKNAADFQFNGVLEYTEDEVVSMDINGSTASAVFDAKAGLTLNDTMLKCVAWYDNESGYSHRVVDMIEYLGKKIPDLNQ